MEIEPRILRDGGAKLLMPYDESLRRLQAAGYDRHLRPTEAMGCIATSVEKARDLGDVCQDMRASYGEWLSVAFERQGAEITVYLDPSGLVWENGSYRKGSQFLFAEKASFEVPTLSLMTYLRELPDGLVRILYGATESALPASLRRSGDTPTGVVFPYDGRIEPAGRGYFGDVANILAGCGHLASRGVRLT